MLKILGLAAVFGMGCTIATTSANAAPLGPVHGFAVEDHILDVRDGCGPGYRYSNRRQDCVPDFDRGPPPPPPPRYYDDRPRRPYDEPPPPRRYYEERGRDYRSDRGYQPQDNDAAAAAAIAGAVAGAIVGSQRDDRPPPPRDPRFRRDQ